MIKLKVGENYIVGFKNYAGFQETFIGNYQGLLPKKYISGEECAVCGHTLTSKGHQFNIYYGKGTYDYETCYIGVNCMKEKVSIVRAEVKQDGQDN